MSRFNQAIASIAGALSLCAVGGSASAQTATGYTTGHISNVMFIGEAVLIMVDAGLPGTMRALRGDG